MDLLSQVTKRQTDPSVSAAEFGDLIQFVNPWLGLSLWAVYVGEGHVTHFGVGDENLTQKACRSLLQLLVPKSNGDRVLKKTRICQQSIEGLKLPAGTKIRVNNNEHNLAPSGQNAIRHRCEKFLQQEFKYDLVNFNSEHFATFIRYGHAVSNQIPFQKNNSANQETTDTLQMIMQQEMETCIYDHTQL